MATVTEDSEKSKETSEGSEADTQKKTAELQALCTCPQKCYERVPLNVKESLLKAFNNLNDNAKQNEYLQSYIEMRSVYKRLWSEEERVGGRLQRRVSCKYKIPLDENGSSEEPTVHPYPSKSHNSTKGQTSSTVNVKEGVRTQEVCQKAFMNIYGITEKRIRLQREKLIAKLRSQSMDLEVKSLRNGITRAKDRSKDVQWTPEQAILDAFFGNQLWRPEYIGMSTDSKTHPTQNLKA